MTRLALRALALASLAVACDLGGGNWDARALAPYGLALIAWFAGEWRGNRAGLHDAAFACACLAGLSLGELAWPHVPEAALWKEAWPWRLEGAVALAGAILLWRRPRWSFALVPALLAVGVAARVLAIGVAPAPLIDVWAANESATRWLLAGVNPYLHRVPDVYQGESLAVFGYVVDAYAYPPANLYAFAPSVLALGDTRYALVAAELLGLAALWWLVVRRHPSRPAVEAMLLGYYLQPAAPHAVAQAWTEPLVVGALALSAALLTTRRERAFAIALGIALSLKQYLFTLGNAATLTLRRWWTLAVSALVALATLAPFLSEPRALVSALTQQSRLPYLAYNLSLNSALQHFAGVHLPVAPVSLALATVGLAVPFLRRVERVWAWNASVYATLFALTYAFYNQHAFVGALMLLATATEVSPSHTSSARP